MVRFRKSVIECPIISCLEEQLNFGKHVLVVDGMPHCLQFEDGLKCGKHVLVCDGVYHCLQLEDKLNCGKQMGL